MTYKTFQNAFESEQRIGKIDEYHYFDDETDGMPIITLEVMPDSSMAETVPYDSFYHDSQPNNTLEEDVKDPNGMPFLIEKSDETPGMHFLVNKSEPVETNDQNSDQDGKTSLIVRNDLMDYTTQSDGSISCKLCGKVLASRSHWYRHKYRTHAVHTVDPVPLFQCEQCLIYFKSRKGYIGHISSKHSETLQDVSPVLTNEQAEALAKEKSIMQTKTIEPEVNQMDIVNNQEPTEPEPMEVEVKKESDPEMSIPKTIVPTYQNAAVKQTKSTETPHRRSTRNTRQGTPRNVDILENANVENEKEWNERRCREEKLVADIIARVRRECEAQGSGGAARRGYSRKPLRT